MYKKWLSHKTQKNLSVDYGKSHGKKPSSRREKKKNMEDGEEEVLINIPQG